jgi:hypothetical protein
MDFISGLATTKIACSAMKDMKAHLERLRDQAAECAILSAEATVITILARDRAASMSSSMSTA